MTETGWRDQIIGARMRVDQEFTDRIQQSPFSRQQWGLIMTAVEFDIDGDGESARLVADTTNVKHVLPELNRIERSLKTGHQSSRHGLEGIIQSIKSTIGLGSRGIDEQTLRRATTLVDEYAVALQAYLEETGRWEQISSEATPTQGTDQGQESIREIDGDQPSPE